MPRPCHTPDLQRDLAKLQAGRSTFVSIPPSPSETVRLSKMCERLFGVGNYSCRSQDNGYRIQRTG